MASKLTDQSIIALCDQQPLSARALCHMLGMQSTGDKERLPIRRSLDRLSERGAIVYSWHIKHRGWMTPALWRKLMPGMSLPNGNEPPKPQPVVNIPRNQNAVSGAVHVRTVQRDGRPVKITRADPPRGRFDVDLKPGTGQISQDWMARRQMQGSGAAR